MQFRADCECGWVRDYRSQGKALLRADEHNDDHERENGERKAVTISPVVK